MSDEQGQGHETGSERDFEEELRGLLAADAYTIRPSPAPYPAIRRRGVAERRRRVTAVGAALVTLAAVPVGAYALGGGGSRVAADTATSPTPSVTASASASASASLSASAGTTSSPSPTEPGQPATEGQLLDGITFEQAVDGLEKCIAYDKEFETKERPSQLGSADNYRIILAMNSTGDSNTPGDGFFVVAVQEEPTPIRVICNVKDGEASGLNTSSGNDEFPEAGPVLVDINSGKLYQQSFMDKGNWKLPFRWGVIGMYGPSVAKVTVSYGDSGTSEAVLDHGWFVTAGTLNQQVTKAPHVKGYDKGGKLVYDSAEDSTYEQTLP
ncbi:hypothetical protein [Streptomyces sp. NPDC046909]|uniref:hypothetical protein n=1 Tax=Streptomyces sp. NPDC046909 TaxID=3155617 RepID=UPI0033D16849